MGIAPDIVQNVYIFLAKQAEFRQNLMRLADKPKALVRVVHAIYPFNFINLLKFMSQGEFLC